MQTAIRISQGKPGGTHYPLGRPVRHPKRNSGTKKEDTAATGKRHDFLTDKIPLPSHRIFGIKTDMTVPRSISRHRRILTISTNRHRTMPDLWV